MRPRPATPGAGQESVWDYPRPPRWDATGERVRVWFGGAEIIDTTRSIRVLETSHPPTYYVPMADIVLAVLRLATGTSLCEWKGRAVYHDIAVGEHVASAAAWSYPQPTPTFAVLVDHVSLYPAAMDRCTVDGEAVQPQPGGFYGGWITSRVTGPFKGEPGTQWW